LVSKLGWVLIAALLPAAPVLDGCVSPHSTGPLNGESGKVEGGIREDDTPGSWSSRGGAPCLALFSLTLLGEVNVSGESHWHLHLRRH